MNSAASEIASPVGVIAGGGAMPFAVAESLKARGIAPVLFALRGACDPVASNASAITGSRSGNSAAPQNCFAAKAAAT